MIRPLPSGVTVCMAASLDGRINQTGTSQPTFTSRHDRDKLFRLRAESDAVLVGAATVRREALPPLVRQKEYQIRRVNKGQSPHPAVVVVSASLDLPWDSEYFSGPDQRIAILTGGPADHKTMEAIRGRNLLLIESGEPLDLARGLAQLQSYGYASFLAEGGGTLTHALFQAGLVDRLHLTLAPIVISGQSTPMLVNGPEFETLPELRLIDCEQVGSELHLVYDT